MYTAIVLYDRAPWRDHLLPLVATRPVADLRVGILTIAQKWAALLQDKVHFLSLACFSGSYPTASPDFPAYLVINGGVLPNDDLVADIQALSVGACLRKGKDWLACVVDDITQFEDSAPLHLHAIHVSYQVDQIQFPESIFRYNAEQMGPDIALLTVGRASAPVSSGNTVYGNHVFVEEGVSFVGVTLDARHGPIYIGSDVVLEPGVAIFGPVALCEGARVKSGARLYPNVTVGPGCTVAGEINNTVLWGDSAKGHDGYLGCAVIGEGCNLGAGTTNSNLRNDWNEVTLYDYTSAGFRSTGLLKCGVVIADHAMIGIQSSITTGTVIGVGAQVAISGILPRYIPDFAWITDKKYDVYRLDAFLAMLERKRRYKNSPSLRIDSRIFESWYGNRTKKYK